jgi:hypothetical protein
LATAAYSQAGAQPEGEAAGPEDAKKDEHVVDAEYKVVDDEKK